VPSRIQLFLSRKILFLRARYGGIAIALSLIEVPAISPESPTSHAIQCLQEGDAANLAARTVQHNTRTSDLHIGEIGRLLRFLRVQLCHR